MLIQVGAQVGWTMPVNDQFKTGMLSLKMKSFQITRAKVLINVGEFFGTIAGAASLEYFGSRNSILLSLHLMVVKWLIIFFAGSIAPVYFFLLLGGMTNAMSLCSFAIYLGEIIPNKIRGTIIAVVTSGYSIGLILGTLLDLYFNAKMFIAAQLIACCLAIYFFTWLHDTPYFLVRIGNLKKTERSIIAYFPFCNQVEKLSEIEMFVVNNSSDETKEKTKFELFREMLTDLKTPVMRKTMLTVLALFAMTNLSGSLSLSYEMILFFGVPNGYLWVYIIANLYLFLFICQIDTLGRRVAYVISSLCTSVGLIGLGIYYCLLGSYSNINFISWLPVIFIQFYIMGYLVGFMTVPFVVLSEIFPNNVKSFVTCIAILTLYLFSFIHRQVYKHITESLGISFALWFFGTISLFATPIVILFLPQTRKKSFLEIQYDLIVAQQIKEVTSKGYTIKEDV